MMQVHFFSYSVLFVLWSNSLWSDKEEIGLYKHKQTLQDVGSLLGQVESKGDWSAKVD